MSFRIWMLCGLTAACFAAFAPAGFADELTFEGSSGVRAAKAKFDWTGTTLTVELQNTATQQIAVPDQVLTAIFFDFLPGLSNFTIVPASGSTVIINNALAPSQVIQSEWDWRQNLATYDDGFSAVGLGLFGGINGVGFGTVSSFGTANQGGLNGREFVKTKVVATFTTSVANTGSELASKLSDIRFLYGSELGEVPLIPGVLVAVPEPATVTTLLMIALAGFGGWRYSRGKQSSTE